MLNGSDPGAPSASDAELQTDVMRFFAILAICVIALTSLVETVEDRQSSEQPTLAAPDRGESAGVQKARVERETTAPELVERERAEPQAAASDPGLAAAPYAARVAAERVPPRPDSRPLAPVRTAANSPRTTVDGTTAAQPPNAAAGPPSPSLRFASPAAMLRLVANRQIEVFARTDAGSFRLSTGGRRFLPASLPSELYLMAPDTVPADLVGALATAAGSGAGATWGVSLAPPIQARLTRALDNGVSGLLLIDAAGRVLPAEPMP